MQLNYWKAKLRIRFHLVASIVGGCAIRASYHRGLETRGPEARPRCAAPVATHAIPILRASAFGERGIVHRHTRQVRVSFLGGCFCQTSRHLARMISDSLEVKK